ncbi:MAG TPA: DinB family protein [Terriglobales bacterium]|nr:DinB family protein [Terriglobales bacterium]
MPALNLLRDILRRVPGRLEKISNDTAESKPTPSSWSPKEELGHLLDSAANNHQRIVRAQFEDKLAMPGYEQNRWVAVHAYLRRDWNELIELWQAFNQQLLAAAEAVPDSAWSHTLTVAGSGPLTLQFVFDDYVAHMLHHLRHIGIEVDDLTSNATNAA